MCFSICPLFLLTRGNLFRFSASIGAGSVPASQEVQQSPHWGWGTYRPDPTAASAPLPAQATLPVFVQWLVTDGLDLVAFSTSALTQYFVFLRAVASTLSRTAEDRDALTSAAELVLSGGSAAPGTDLRGAPWTRSQQAPHPPFLPPLCSFRFPRQKEEIVRTERGCK